MPDQPPRGTRRTSRTADERSADHAAIDRLSTELLPALVAKLGATGLGELEVREGAWRVRLRRPAGGAPPAGAHGPAAGTRERRGDRGTERVGADRSDRHDRPARVGRGGDGHDRPDAREIATSPAVGIYRPRTDLTVGERVRVGDRLGAVDMLGIAQEVLAPVDGVVGASLAESGDAVEYGQRLLVIEVVATATPAAPSTNGTGA